MPSIDIYLVCPYCFRDNVAASSPSPDWTGPKPGDVSICWVCGRVAMVNQFGNALRQLTPDEEAMVKDDRELQQFRFIVMTSRRPSDAIRRAQEGEP